MKSCVELLRSCGINILVVFSDIPVFSLDYKLPATLNIELVTFGGLSGRVEFKELFVCLPLTRKGSQLGRKYCAVKASCSQWKKNCEF